MEKKDVQPIYIGLFKDREGLENTFNDLCKKGYDKNSINILMSTDTQEKYFSTEKSQSEKSTGPGSPLSNVYKIADVVNASFKIPGQSVVVAGPISAGLSGAGAGGFSRGIVESLMGIPEVYACKFESGLKHNWIVISIRPRNEEDANYIEQIWHKNNVEEIYKK